MNRGGKHDFLLVPAVSLWTWMVWVAASGGGGTALGGCSWEQKNLSHPVMLVMRVGCMVPCSSLNPGCMCAETGFLVVQASRVPPTELDAQLPWIILSTWRLSWRPGPLCPSESRSSSLPWPPTAMLCADSQWWSETFVLLCLCSRHSHHHRRTRGHVDRWALLSPSRQADGQQLDPHEDGWVEASTSLPCVTGLVLAGMECLRHLDPHEDGWVETSTSLPSVTGLVWASMECLRHLGS